MDEQEQKAKRRDLRSSYGFCIAIGWMFVWWRVLANNKDEALARCVGEGVVGAVGNAICRSNAEGAFYGGLVMALIATPLAFWVAHHIARAQVGQDVEKRRQQETAAHENRLHEQQEALRRMGESAAQEANSAQRDNDRYEVITRLGAVDDQLIVLETEKDAERTTRIRLTIAQALREIDAKFTDAQLRAMFEEHVPLRGRVNRTLSEMRRLGMGDTRQYADLIHMFGLDDAPEESEAPSGSALPVTG